MYKINTDSTYVSWNWNYVALMPVFRFKYEIINITFLSVDGHVDVDVDVD